MSDDSVTILKYKIGVGAIAEYRFYVMDKFDEADEPTRLDKMIAYSDRLNKMYKHYEQLWIKTCPIFATKG